MTTQNIRPSTNGKPAAHPDDTGPQLEALLAGLTPMGGHEAAGSMPDYVDGRRLVEKMADTAEGDRTPNLPLTVEQCAQVIGFLSLADNKWMKDPPDSPNHVVGLVKLLNVLKNNLREAAVKRRPSKVTPISDAVPGSLEDLNNLLGYDGSIQGTPLDEALEEQLTAIHEAQAVIACANEYITHIAKSGDDEWRPQLALGAVLKMLDRVYEALDAGNLEDRALAIARAKRDESEEAAS